ncbi:alpha/beta hydrolase [Salmonella enterica]|nr:alpha/beta hydrolase [Salmonella enterica]
MYIMIFVFPLVAFGNSNKVSLISMVDPEYHQFVIQKPHDIDSNEKLIAEQSIQDEKDLKNNNNASFDLKKEIKTKHNQKLALYIYRPDNKENNLPVIYFMHGGGYIMGKANNNKYFSLAKKLNANIISVDYTLASRAPYPADLNDAYDGLLYIYQSGASLGLNNKKIILMGESAGGGLAARLAIKNLNSENIPLLGQVLIYPMLDYRTGSILSPYQNDYSGHFSWTRKSNHFGWEKLRGGKNIPLNEMKYFSPSIAKINDLKGLPKTFIYVGDIDLFVNEDIDFVNKLVLAGVQTEFHLIPGAIHAFDHINPNSKLSKKYLDIRNEAIVRMFQEVK